MNKLTRRLEYLETALRWKKFIIYSTFIICTVIAIYSLVVTKKYQADVKLLPPRQDNYSSLMAGVANLTSVFLGGQSGFSLPPLTSPSEIYKELLESRTIREKLIREFDLMNEYEVPVIEEALDIFNNNLNIKVTFAGFVEISYIDTDTLRVKNLLDRLIFVLDSTYTTINTNYHRFNRQYFDKQLDFAQSRVNESEIKLAAFQNEHGIYEVTEQVSQLINLLTTLETQKLQLVFQKGLLDYSLTKDSYKRKSLELQIKNIEEQIDEIMGGSNVELALDFNKIPTLSLKYAELLRDYEINQTIYGFILQQYEQAKFLEEKEIPSIIPLDLPQIPQKRIYPKRRNMVLLAFFFSIFVNFVFIMYKEKSSKFKSDYPEEYDKIRKLLNEHFSWKKK